MRCITCGNEVSNNDSVCPVCGTSRSENVQRQDAGANYGGQNNKQQGSFCMMCGKAVAQGYKICPECMNSQIAEAAPKKKKSYTWLIILLVILILLVGAVAAGFGTGFIPTMISDFAFEESEESIDEEVDGDTDIEEENVSNPEESTVNKQNNISAESEPKETVCEIVVPGTDDSIITWTDASHNAKNFGGKLVSINSREEFEKITTDANEKKLVILWVGAKRKEGQKWEDVKWLDGTEMSFTQWLDKEPSYESDGEKEYYLMLVKIGQEWYFNDTANDITPYYSHLTDKVGYVVEKELE